MRELSFGRGFFARWPAFAVALAGVVLVGLGLPRDVVAQTEVADSRLRVVFVGPAECGANDRLLELTRALLKNHVNHGDVRVDAVVSRRANGKYRLHLELHGSVEGERYLVAANCDEALGAAAVVIALAVNPEVFTEAPEEAPGSAVVEAPANQTESATASSLQQDKPPAVPDRSPASSSGPAGPDSGARAGVATQLRLGASARMAYGLTDEPRFGGRATFGVTLGAVEGRLHGVFDPTTESRDVFAGAVQFTSYGAGADLCARMLDEVLGVALCGGWQLTQVTATAPELSRANKREALVSAANVGVSLDWTFVTDVAVVADVGVAIPTTRPRFVVDLQNGETVEISKVQPGPSAALGLQWRL